MYILDDCIVIPLYSLFMLDDNAWCDVYLIIFFLLNETSQFPYVGISFMVQNNIARKQKVY